MMFEACVAGLGNRMKTGTACQHCRRRSVHRDRTHVLGMLYISMRQAGCIEVLDSEIVHSTTCRQQVSYVDREMAYSQTGSTASVVVRPEAPVTVFGGETGFALVFIFDPVFGTGNLYK